MSIYIRDPTVAQEARTFVIKPNGKAEHQKGCHDDCVLADALTVVGIMQMPKPKAPADVARAPGDEVRGSLSNRVAEGSRVRLRSAPRRRERKLRPARGGTANAHGFTTSATR